MRLLCRLYWHDWKPWSVETVNGTMWEGVDGKGKRLNESRAVILVQARSCAACHFAERRQEVV